MSEYKDDYTDDFLKDLKKIKKNFKLQSRLESKVDEILKDPTHYKPLRNILKGKRRVHIGSYVLIFEFDEAQKIVIFHNFEHHDKIY